MAIPFFIVPQTIISIPYFFYGTLIIDDKPYDIIKYSLGEIESLKNGGEYRTIEKMFTLTSQVN